MTSLCGTSMPERTMVTAEKRGGLEDKRTVDFEFNSAT